MMESAAVRSRAATLPTEPGVYQFLADDTVLYVGKAVDLCDRVRAYAGPEAEDASHAVRSETASGARSERIQQMVARAEDVEVVVTDTEAQALLLEANLIKRHQPRYNVRLRDDKSYPLVQVTAHPAPRIEITRDPADGADVFGPFTDKGSLETVVKAIRETYGLRGCSDHKYANRDRPCLDYDIGLCSAPCTGEISQEAYREDVEAVRRFFRGETGVLADPIREAMDRAAEAAAFERAANLRDRLEVVESFHDGAGGVVRSEGGQRTDVLGVVTGEAATVARLHSADGSLVERERHVLETPDGNEAGDVLAAFVPQYYADRELPDRLLLSAHLTDEDVADWLAGAGVEVRVPGAGREATLVDLALKNARRASGRSPGDGTAALADALGLDSAARIEGFDVSHTGGSGVVGSDVVFVEGTPEKPDYRRKKLPEGNDDYAAMRALLEWRASRAVEGRDDRPDPDLLVIDGGEGQLAAAREGLAAAGWDRPAIALAKADERVIAPDEAFDWEDAPQLRLLQRVRDEAHRFAVQYHETLRDDVSTALDDVPGVGPETRNRLLGRFGSVEGIRAASREELRDVPGVGEQTAATIDRQL